MSDIRQVVISFGAIFKHAAKLERNVYQICHDNGLSDEDVCKPFAVVPTRFFSFFEFATTTRKLWQHLLAFIDSPVSHGEKKNELQALLGDDKHLFIKFMFLLRLYYTACII